MPSDDHEFITTMLDYFSEFEEWLPDWIDWLSHIVLGEIPLAKANDVYDLADQWEQLATELHNAYQDVQKAADPILNNWSGDASAAAFVEQWYAYLEGLRGSAEGAAQMRSGVQGFGLEVELMKYMVAINLLMLAVSIYMLIVAAIPSGGGSLGAAPGLFTGFRLALGKLAENTVGRIASIVVRFAIKPLTNLFLKLPANLATRALAAGARFAVPLVTRITLGHAIPAGVVKALVYDGAKRIAETWLGKLATNVVARGVSKAVANRLAAQALRGMAGDEIRGRLASQTARAVQKQLAKEIQQQLMKNWAGKKLGSKFVETALTKTAVEEAAKVGLGKEFAHYIGSRVAFGAGFMGGGDLGAQLLQMGAGNRDSLDWGHIQNSAVQGGVFGASMFGGPVGHTVGGALAGGGMGIVGQLGSDKPFNWSEVGHQAVMGASAGVIFGGQTHLEMSTLGGGKLTIGKDLHLLSGEDGGFSAVSTRFNKAEGLQEHLVLTDNGYVGWQGAHPGAGETGGLRVLPDEVAARPEVADHIQAKWGNDPDTVLTQSPSPAGSNTATAPRPETTATPARAEAGGGGGPRQGGGGGGGGGGTPVRAGEAGPSTGGEGSRSAGNSGHAGGDVSHGDSTSGGAPAADRAIEGTDRAGASDRVAPEAGADRAGASDRVAPEPGANRAGASGHVASESGSASAGGDHGSAGGDRVPTGGDRAASHQAAGDGAAGHERADGRRDDVAPVGRPTETPHRADVDSLAGRGDPGPVDRGAGPGQVADRALGVGDRGGEVGPRDGGAGHPPHDGPPNDGPPRDPTSARPEDAAAAAGSAAAGSAAAGSAGVGAARSEGASSDGRGVGDRPERAGGGDGADGRRGPGVPGRGDSAGGGGVRRVEDPRLVPVDGVAPERAVARPEDVETVADREIGGLIEGREPGAPDLPHRADFDQESGTMRVRYGDGVELDVSVQVNESLPPGGAVVRRPAMEELGDGTWRQADSAAIGLSPHVPAEPAARAPYVRDNLDNAFRKLHGEVGGQLRPPAGEAGPGTHDVAPAHDAAPQHAETAGPRPAEPAEPAAPERAETSGPGRAEPSGAERADSSVPQRAAGPEGLRGLEEVGGPDVGLRDHDGVVRHAAEPAEPPLPKQLSSAEIHAILRGQQMPEQLPRWAGEHLADQGQHGPARPKASDEVSERLRVLGDESVDRVTPRGWEEPASRFPELEALEPGRTGHEGPREPEVRDHESLAGRDHESGSAARDHDGPAPHERDSAAPHERDSAAPHERDEAAPHERDEAGPHGRDEAGPHGRDEAGPHEVDRAGERPRPPDKPPIEEMIPRHDLTPEQRAAAEAELERAFQATLDGQDFAGLQVKVAYAEVRTDHVHIEMSIRAPGEEHTVGSISRIFMREPGGELVVSHDSLKVDAAYQGRGFAGEFNRHMEGWYRDSGVDHIKVVTSWVGGYTWGKAGFEWQLGGGHKVFAKLKIEIGDIGRHLSGMDHYGAEELRPLYEKYGGDTPAELSQNMRMQRHEAQSLVGRADGAMSGALPKHEYPTPREVADLGYRESVHGRGTSADRAAAHWVGKDAMVDTMWHGRRYLDGPPPEEYLGYDPALRAEPAGGTTHTASGIENTGFVPDGRPGHLPDVTVEEMRAAADHVEGQDFAGRDIVGVTSDGPYVRVDLADGSSRHFVTEIGHDMSTLGKSEVRAGTPQDPHVVTVNHRVAPEQLSRVWVHEITETLAIQHTEAAGRPPQGLLRRATATIGRAFGFGDGPSRPPVDPHAAARINERVHLERQFRDATGDRAEQNRLRNEIAGVERDLETLGHPVAPSLVHQLANVLPAGGLIGASHGSPHPVHDLSTGPHESGPELRNPAPEPHDPVAEPHGPDGSHLIDPPWTHGETPPVGDLLPHTPEQAANWHGAIHDAVVQKFEGRTYADMRVEVENVRVSPHAVEVKLKVFDAQGHEVGRSVRVLERHPDEDYLRVKNQSLNLNDDVRGGGFAREYNDHLERWYRESGVRQVDVTTAKVGGYAWARQGFSWPEFGGLDPIRRLGDEAHHITDLLRGLDGRDAEGLRPLYDKYGGDNPDELRANMLEQRRDALQIVRRMQEVQAGERPSSDWPTTEDVLGVGHRGDHGRDAHWVGKDALLDSTWSGSRRLDQVPGPEPLAAAHPPAVHEPISLHDNDISGMPDLRGEEVPPRIDDNSFPRTDEHAPPRGDEHAPPRGDERRRTEPLHLLAFDDVPDGPMQRGTLRDLAGALGEGGDRVALRAPGLESGELGPNVRALPADPIPGVTGRISPLLRPDHLPADADVVVGYGQTAGVAEARRDAYPDARVVQIVDTVPTDPAHLDVLSRADLVIAVGPEVADGLRGAFERHGSEPVPPVHEVVPPVDGGGPPPPTRDPGRDGYHVLVTGGERAQLAAAETVRELRSQGVDARLTVAVRDADGPEANWHRDRLSEVADSEVTVRRLPDDVAGRRELLHRADVVIDPVARPELDPLVLQATGDGVPVLVHSEGGAGRLLGDPLRVSDEHGAGSVVRDGGDAAGWSDHLRRTFDDLPAQRDRAMSLRHEMTERYGREAVARSVHDAIHDLGDGVARVGDERFHDTLDAGEVVRRNAVEDAPTDPDAVRVMTVCTEYDSNAGGVITANRELSQSFRTNGAEVYGRVSLVSASEPHLTRHETEQGIHVRGVHDVWGVLDEKGQPDRRAMSMLLDNLPADVDVIVGNSRFGGGAARILQEHVYPEAKYVHVLHTSPEVLDGVRGKPGEGQDRAATERELMTGADLVTGIGPLLGQEAARLAAGVPGETPPAHTIISDMPRDPGPAPSRTPGDRYELHVRGRADDTIKGVEMAARMVRELRAEGLDVHLTVRGAPDGAGPRMAERLSEIAGNPVEVREFVPSGTEEGRAQLRQDLVDADLVLMPSVQDGFGLVASEAAQAGVPVVVGEGTGAGMFFGDERYVPEHLGEAATVRDGNTVGALRDRVDRVAGDAAILPDHVVDGVLRDVDEARLGAWVDHVRSALHGLDEHYARAGGLRDHIAEEYAPGSAARGVLEVLRGDAPADPPYAPHADQGGPHAERGAPHADQGALHAERAAAHEVAGPAGPERVEAGAGDPVRENRVLNEMPDPRHNASPIEDTEFVPDGRPEDVADVTVPELHDAAREVVGADFSEGVVHSVDVAGDLVRVTMTDGEVRHFRTEVGENMRNLAETTVRDGTPDRPHVVKVNHRVAGDQLSRVWVHEITETLAMKHAEQARPHEHGLIRRPAEAIARQYGEAGESGPPRPVDPHTAARINERLHLQRRLDAAEGHPELQERLRHEIAGVERDLIELGHADPPRHWAERPERPPNLDELIPRDGAGHWSEAARAELAGRLDGHRFGDRVLRLDGEDAIRVRPDEVTIRFRAETTAGEHHGAETRVFTREPDGSLVVRHEGRSGNERFDRQMLEFYREAGVDRVETPAVGRDGYELAREGYQWGRQADAEDVGRILDALERRADEIEHLRTTATDEGALRERFGGRDPEETRANLAREVADARQLVERARSGLGHPDFPTPREIAEAGTAEGWHRGRTSLGEEVMAGQEWPAELPIEHTAGDSSAAPPPRSVARPGEDPALRFKDSELRFEGTRDQLGRKLYTGPDRKNHFPGDQRDTSRGIDGRLRKGNRYVDEDNPQPLPGMQARAVGDDAGAQHYDARPGDGPEGAVHDQMIERDRLHREYTDLWKNDLEPLVPVLKDLGITMDRKHFGDKLFGQIMQKAMSRLEDLEQLDTLQTAGERYLELDKLLRTASERLGTRGGDLVKERQFPGARELTPGVETPEEPGRPDNLDRILLWRDPENNLVLVGIEEKGAGSTLGSRGVEDPGNLGGRYITAEQCSPEYLRHMLQHDVKLAAFLEANPQMRPVLQEIINSERAGSLRYLQVHVSDRGHVTATDYLMFHDRLRPGSIRLVGE
ncbi:glycosyltransferase [Actinoplanes sp. HUAS TT8]|uniref:WXG100-like domain-containing protein n=1 Tax=Actinoplanes sp. HUAS TT8 TaxID=3447453 RepID=UPI003F5219AC